MIFYNDLKQHVHLFLKKAQLYCYSGVGSGFGCSESL